MNIIAVVDLKQLVGKVNILFVIVDVNGKIICDLKQCGYSEQDILTFLGISNKFQKKQIVISSIVPQIRIMPIFPGEVLPDNMNQFQMALLVFNYQEQSDCPKVVFFKQRIITNNEYKEKIQAYEKLEILGHGTYGSVQQVKEKVTGNEYAMKVIDIIKASQNYGEVGIDKAIQLISQEIQLQTQIQSENIIKIIDSFISASNAIIIMEIGGQNLYQYVGCSAGFLTIQDVVSIFKQICNAVKVLHDHGIIHRDIKPDNFVICGKFVKLTDFGYAKQCDFASTCLGTPTYMAPEVIKSNAYSQSADIFSLGCILYFLLTKKTTFGQAAKSREQIFKNICDVEPDPIQLDQYPIQFIDLCKSMMMKQATNRPNINSILDTINDIIIKLQINIEISPVVSQLYSVVNSQTQPSNPVKQEVINQPQSQLTQPQLAQNNPTNNEKFMQWQTVTVKRFKNKGGLFQESGWNEKGTEEVRFRLCDTDGRVPTAIYYVDGWKYGHTEYDNRQENKPGYNPRSILGAVLGTEQQKYVQNGTIYPCGRPCEQGQVCPNCGRKM